MNFSVIFQIILTEAQGSKSKKLEMIFFPKGRNAKKKKKKWKWENNDNNKQTLFEFNLIFTSDKLKEKRNKNPSVRYHEWMKHCEMLVSEWERR